MKYEEENERNKTLSFSVYPNPFTQKTHIRISEPAQIIIYDRTERAVKTLISKPGDYTIEWNGTDNNNKKVKSGVYFVRVS